MKRMPPLLLCLLISACTQVIEVGAPLEGTEWTLASLNGQAPLESHPVTLHFQDTELGGNSGCNTYGAKYEADGAKLRLPEDAAGVGIWSTAMACIPPDGSDVMGQEEQYLRALQEVESYRVAGDRLELMDAAGQPILVFERAR